ncbi:hypothetical protein [Sporohalobacter salinus]|uniref:hypothetical protein n=1 Tax=Sporohalobacter salinus TaxID=1494606 RepID=UPI00195F8358|nr:hypothetical protein [Sporohalobacter salinus]MBM7625084.1 Fe-S cluster assembly iron-binding protein IscA [Sporohalobacter salinus]
MTLVESKDDEDKLIEIEGFEFLLNPEIIDQLKGAEIDYKSSFFGSGFSVTGT